MIIGVLILLNMGSVIYCQDNVMFNYQGRVKVQGSAFTGTGNFKFAIVNNAGDESLWSNDGTSAGGGEPSASIAITVTDGIFNAMVGDTGLGMAAINRTVFNHPSQIKLRTWFSDGTHGFQQLLPDQKLVNVELLGIISGSTDFTIYVDGSTGDDENNGLSPSKAKNTIQAAVDVLPERLNCNVTIDIANGVYRECVKIHGISVMSGKYLKLVGDDSWFPTSGGDPAVRITGCDEDISHTKIRDASIIIQNCANIWIQGFLFDYTTQYGLFMTDGSYIVKNCKAANTGETGGYYGGFVVRTNSKADFYDCMATLNKGAGGFYLRENSYSQMANCVSYDNDQNGIYVDTFCHVFFRVTGKYSNNDYSGIVCGAHAWIWFYSDYTGEIKDNKNYGIRVRFQSFCMNDSRNSYLNNTLGNTFAEYDSYLW